MSEGTSYNLKHKQRINKRITATVYHGISLGNYLTEKDEENIIKIADKVLHLYLKQFKQGDKRKEMEEWLNKIPCLESYSLMICKPKKPIEEWKYKPNK